MWLRENGSKNNALYRSGRNAPVNTRLEQEDSTQKADDRQKTQDGETKDRRQKRESSQ